MSSQPDPNSLKTGVQIIIAILLLIFCTAVFYRLFIGAFTIILIVIIVFCLLDGADNKKRRN